MTTFGVITIISLGLIVVVIGILIGTYNGLVKLKNNVEEGFSTMDVYLKKRFDLVPNLVETVKGYATHEEETLKEVVMARSSIQSASSIKERLLGENTLTETLRSLMAISEAYPDLKANQNFLALQEDLNRIEEDILNSRKYYNGVVKMFNNKCEMFPSNIIAGIFAFSRKPMYQVNQDMERENIKVKFQ